MYVTLIEFQLVPSLDTVYCEVQSQKSNALLLRVVIFRKAVQAVYALMLVLFLEQKI